MTVPDSARPGDDARDGYRQPQPAVPTVLDEL